MCICVSVSLGLCVSVYLCTCVSVDPCLCVSVYRCIRSAMHLCTCASVYPCVCVCANSCRCVTFCAWRRCLKTKTTNLACGAKMSRPSHRYNANGSRAASSRARWALACELTTIRSRMGCTCWWACVLGPSVH